MLGDLNINISANTETGGSETYLDHLISSGSIPIITLPTRVTDTSSTLIDHNTTNDTTQSCQRAEDFGAGPARTRFFKPEPGPNPNPNLSVRPSPILSPKSKTSHYLLKNL